MPPLILGGVVRLPLPFGSARMRKHMQSADCGYAWMPSDGEDHRGKQYIVTAGGKGGDATVLGYGIVVSEPFVNIDQVCCYSCRRLSCCRRLSLVIVCGHVIVQLIVAFHLLVLFCLVQGKAVVAPDVDIRNIALLHIVYIVNVCSNDTVSFL